MTLELTVVLDAVRHAQPEACAQNSSFMYVCTRTERGPYLVTSLRNKKDSGHSALHEKASNAADTSGIDTTCAIEAKRTARNLMGWLFPFDERALVFSLAVIGCFSQLISQSVPLTVPLTAPFGFGTSYREFRRGLGLISGTNRILGELGSGVKRGACGQSQAWQWRPTAVSEGHPREAALAGEHSHERSSLNERKALKRDDTLSPPSSFARSFILRAVVTLLTRPFLWYPTYVGP